MADKKHAFEDAEVERTTRWVEHEELQSKLKKWKVAFAAVPILGAILLYYFFG